MKSLGERLGNSDRDAFAELYDACADRVFRFLASILGCEADAEDALQETFVRVARNGKKIAKAENVIAYVFMIARNEALRLIERKKKRRSSSHLNENLSAADRSPQGHDETEAILAALASLSEEHREVVELKYFGDLTFREIAEATGMPQGTIATRYRSAIEKLRSILAKELP